MADDDRMRILRGFAEDRIKLLDVRAARMTQLAKAHGDKAEDLRKLRDSVEAELTQRRNAIAEREREVATEQLRRWEQDRDYLQERLRDVERELAEAYEYAALCDTNASLCLAGSMLGAVGLLIAEAQGRIGSELWTPSPQSVR